MCIRRCVINKAVNKLECIFDRGSSRSGLSEVSCLHCVLASTFACSCKWKACRGGEKNHSWFMLVTKWHCILHASLLHNDWRLAVSSLRGWHKGAASSSKPLGLKAKVFEIERMWRNDCYLHDVWFNCLLLAPHGHEGFFRVDVTSLGTHSHFSTSISQSPAFVLERNSDGTEGQQTVKPHTQSFAYLFWLKKKFNN